MKMIKKNHTVIYLVLGSVLCLIAAFFSIYAFRHPALLQPYPMWLRCTIAGLYAIYTILIFCMPLFKDASPAVCVILLMDFSALALIAFSIGMRKITGESNWYLPAGLFLTCFANFANLYRQKKTAAKAAER